MSNKGKQMKHGGIMDASEIKEVLQNYFDASYESDGKKMAEVFHEVAHLYMRG
jgi:hypothetical protein